MRTFGFAVACLLSVAVAAYAVGVYGFGPGAAILDPVMRANFEAHAFAIHAHIFASALALLIGPLQFSARLRRARPALHRWLGRIYLGVAVAVGGLAGLYMSLHASGGLTGKFGFAFLALAWLYTGARAYLAARERNFAAHRRWMIRNFALTFAAVTLRIYLPGAMLLQLPGTQAYAAIAWLCWVPNLLVAQWLLRRDGVRP